MTRFMWPRDAWDEGPWDTEPDEDQSWFDGPTGLRCLARRASSGNWCGYVGVPKTHPAHGLTYYLDADFDPEKREIPWTSLARNVPRFQRADAAMERLQREAYQRKVAEWRAAQGRVPIQTMVNHLTAHGGLTYSAAWPDIDRELWFFGFDCGHAWDLSPALRALTRSLPGYRDEPQIDRHETYRTLDYVRKQCASLALQLADIQQTVERIGVIDVKNMSPSDIAKAIIETTGTLAAKEDD